MTAHQLARAHSAPIQRVVEQERAKLAKYEEMYANLSDRIEVLSK